MLRRLLLSAAGLSLLSACATGPAPVSVAETIAATPALSTLNQLIAKAGLADTLKTGGPYTVFAPTNDAFKAVPAKTLDEIGNNPERLRAVLLYHVLPAKVMAAEVKSGPAKTAQGANLAIAKAGSFVTVEDGVVQSADLGATNGVVHTIDRVLLPPVKR